jgi:hypothetical protein
MKRKKCLKLIATKSRRSRANTGRELKRLISIEMWQKLGDAAIFAAAWKLVELRHLKRGGNLEDLRMRRDRTRLLKVPWSTKSPTKPESVRES